MALLDVSLFAPAFLAEVDGWIKAGATVGLSIWTVYVGWRCARRLLGEPEPLDWSEYDDDYQGFDFDPDEVEDVDKDEYPDDMFDHEGNERPA